MAHTNTTTKGIRTLLASTVVALGIGAPTLGVAGAAEDAVTAITTTTAATVTTTAPARQEPPAASVAHRVELDEALILAEAPEQVDLVIWALGRYEEAGLELPYVEIQAHSDRAGCNGLSGSLTDKGGAGYLIHICSTEFTMLHELGHAWDMHTLSGTDRKAFLGVAAATTWNNSEHWHLAGGEHAANVIAWGLMEERIHQTRTQPNDPRSMAEAYELLTGNRPLWEGDGGAVTRVAESAGHENAELLEAAAL
jgi:hypothetical protein